MKATETYSPLLGTYKQLRGCGRFSASMECLTTRWHALRALHSPHSVAG